MKIIKEDTGFNNDGKEIIKYILENDNDVSVEIISQGCAITKFLSPDKNGVLENIVLSYPILEQYIDNPDCMGAIGGRTIGRISGASFEIHGNRYELQPNEGNNLLHGGQTAFHLRNWHSSIMTSYDKEVELGQDEVGVKFTHTSPNGEGGYPGEVCTRVYYRLDNHNTLHMDIYANSTEDTIFDVANHSYFNVANQHSKNLMISHWEKYSNIGEQYVRVAASKFIPVCADGCPMGMIAGVDGTAFDLRHITKLQTGIMADETQIKRRGGYDHPLLFDKNLTKECEYPIQLVDKISGRMLSIRTTAEAVVIYTANHLSHAGICFETQGIPDAINHKSFDVKLLTPTSPYHSYTSYHVSVL